VEPITVTFVCDQNRARSPLAAAMLSAALAERFATGVEVGSAGIYARPGLPAMPEVIAAADALGLELRGHASRPLDDRITAASDLIVTMTHVQADLIGGRHGGIVTRLFVLGELAGLTATDGPLPTDLPIADRLERLHARRPLRGSREDDDVADPVGHGPDVLAATVARLDTLVRTMATGMMR
jgi:protein-tyrosine phosphatase